MQRIATASSAVRRAPSASGPAPLRLPIFVGLLVGLLPATAVLSGCGGPKSPPKVPIVTAPEVAVPTPAAPADPTLFAYLHIGDPIQFVQQTLGGQYIEYAVQRGIKVADFQSGAPLVAFLWDPQGASLKEAPAVVLAPLPSDGDLAGLIKSTSPLLRTAPFAQSKTATVITLGDAAQERAKASEAALLALTQAKQPFEATLHVNATPIMAKYGPLMHAGIKNMAPMLATAAAQSPSAPNAQSSVAMLDQLVSELEGLKSFTLGANTSEDDLLLSTLTASADGTPGATAGGPLAVPDLAQFVPPGDLRLQWNTRDVKRLLDWYLRVYGGFLAAKPELKAQVDELLADWLKAGRTMETAASLSFDPAKGLVMQGLMRVPDSAAAMAAIRRIVKKFSSGPVHDQYKNLGIELTIKSQQGVRKVKGNPVDRYEYSFHRTADPGQGQTPPAVKTLLDKMSGLTYEVAQVGPYLVYTIGAPIESVTDGLFAGKGPYPMAAMKNFPGGGTLYLELDMAGVMRWLKAVVPASRLPIVPARASTVSAWSYDGGAVSYQRFVIPLGLIKALSYAIR
ncbi:MAG TPA: hypothetical protein PLW65_03950 [Pseudomonadota bacterium]|nr:hypothetical protein [Pseudomonadota bacterium]